MRLHVQFISHRTQIYFITVHSAAYDKTFVLCMSGHNTDFLYMNNISFGPIVCIIHIIIYRP